LLSRLPVGSSANTIRGRPTRARATATRCSWPRTARVACGSAGHEIRRCR
jgi:hypothetical protein